MYTLIKTLVLNVKSHSFNNITYPEVAAAALPERLAVGPLRGDLPLL